ncbi:MAG: shikimate dehydrogenase [Candidatus Faecalibacterium intestinavium]|uniref:Shikimate kinase n=1 Tax=Candidatus Faecalibacterium intestinavium TaxID=2838580 RepID=A0A9E2KKL7_9FIRM|nr:shikimate dehydrogenase [Candidatus Faecalibacterium intestinavium]
MEYGLIGSRLGHSYSKIIHEMLCDYQYELCPLPTEAEARAFLEKKAFQAINVTLPYKRLVMEYCAEIDPRAEAIGAVNTVVNRGGRLVGYNTDYMGFEYLCRSHGVEFKGRTVLILGTGGTHNTTSAVARSLGASRILTVSRTPDPAKGELSYREAVASGAQIVINTTPAGMYPNVGTCSLDVASMPGLEAVLDVVYNPYRTELLLRAEEAGVPITAGGLEMLVGQAVYAAEYFLGRPFADAEGRIGRVYRQLRKELLNVVLIGMPGSGKTTVGKALADALGRTFVDLDQEIVQAAGRPIPEIFTAEGEDGFRARESEQAARFGKENRRLLSCGGGIVKRGENIRALRQNGVILWLDRPVEALTVGRGRPLSSSAEAVRRMAEERRPLYAAAADAVVPNHTTIEAAVKAALETLDEIFDT